MVVEEWSGWLARLLGQESLDGLSLCHGETSQCAEVDVEDLAGVLSHEMAGTVDISVF